MEERLLRRETCKEQCKALLRSLVEGCGKEHLATLYKTFKEVTQYKLNHLDETQQRDRVAGALAGSNDLPLAHTKKQRVSSTELLGLAPGAKSGMASLLNRKQIRVDDLRRLASQHGLALGADAKKRELATELARHCGECLLDSTDGGSAARACVACTQLRA